MFRTKEDQSRYIQENYPEVTDSRINEDHWDIYCPQCKTVRGFQAVERSEGREHGMYATYNVDNYAPYAVYFRCPVCRSYKQWVMYRIYTTEEREGGRYSVERYYRVASLPNEGIEEIDELPTEPSSLRIAYKQAVRAMDANAHIAAAAMFRRALQIITREILGATPGKLANELKDVVGKKYDGVIISNDFSDVGYIVKEAGNQGAHADSDPDLLDFTAQDSEDLQRIFMELVSDLFVVPKIQKKSKEDFLQRRKIDLE